MFVYVHSGLSANAIASTTFKVWYVCRNSGASEIFGKDLADSHSCPSEDVF